MKNLKFLGLIFLVNFILINFNILDADRIKDNKSGTTICRYCGFKTNLHRDIAIHLSPDQKKILLATIIERGAIVQVSNAIRNENIPSKIIYLPLEIETSICMKLCEYKEFKKLSKRVRHQLIANSLAIVVALYLEHIDYENYIEV
ncbi:hypothetical protein KAW80_03305 [Candidatus Babeliales bacterium]|nr:hypothetical protein [Candidatus Babeliales bacterium]